MMIDGINSKLHLRSNPKMIALILLFIVLLISPISSNNDDVYLSHEESKFHKVTKITLIDEDTIRIETWYEFVLGAGEILPFSNVCSDAIITEGELKNIVCKLNGHNFPWKLQYVSDRPDSKYIGASGKADIEVGKESIFYLSYTVSTSDLYNEQGIIDFKIALSIPKSSEEIPYSSDVGVCSNSEDWTPYNPFPDSYFDKEKNCEVHESFSRTIVEGGEFVLKKVHFQRRDLIDVIEWNQYIIVSPEREIAQKIDYSAEIPVP